MTDYFYVLEYSLNLGMGGATKHGRVGYFKTKESAEKQKQKLESISTDKFYKIIELPFED